MRFTNSLGLTYIQTSQLLTVSNLALGLLLFAYFYSTWDQHRISMGLMPQHSYCADGHFRAPLVLAKAPIAPIQIPLAVRIVADQRSSMHEDRISEDLLQAVQHLNEVSDGYFHFTAFAKTPVREAHSIPEMHLAFAKTPSAYDTWIAEQAVRDTLTVFIAPTHATEAGRLLGFTPSLEEDPSHLLEIGSDTSRAKLFGHLFIAPDALTSGTLAHEVYHWLSLQHPWDMDDADLVALGLDSEDAISANLMSYSDEERSLTEQQKAVAFHHFITYRSSYGSQ